MSSDIRSISADELTDYVVTFRSILGLGQPSDEEIDLWRPTIELDRTIAAFEDRQIVATAGSISFQVTVPGASVPMAGVTRVAVLTTHRRRGLLRAMMRIQLDSLHERGEAIAGLFASEAPIYGRFGYGLASHHATIEVVSHSAFRTPTSERGRVVFADTSRALQTFPAVWEAARKNQPGMVDVQPARWKSLLADLPNTRQGGTEQYRVLYEEDGLALGFARYRLQQSPTGRFETDLALLDLIATTPTAYAALWRLILDVDLVHRVRAERRSVDEPLTFLLVDTRAVEKRLPESYKEGLWLRLVDVPTALAGRRYGVEGSLVFEVKDEFCPWNVGRFGLDGSPEEAVCRKTRASADLALDAADLASAYLGGNRFQTLQWAGRVAELSDGAVARADAMFGGWPTPWCPLFF